jgi:hypothetical protein
MNGFSHLPGIANQHQVTKGNRRVNIEIFYPQPNPVLTSNSFARFFFIIIKTLSFGVIVTCFVYYIPRTLAYFRWDENSVNCNQIKLVRFGIFVSFKHLN